MIFTRLFDHKNVYNTPKFRFCALFIGQTDNLFLPKIEEREDFKQNVSSLSLRKLHEILKYNSLPVAAHMHESPLEAKRTESL